MAPIVNHIAGGNHELSQAAGAAAEFYWPDVGHGPETAGLHHRGPGGDGELRAIAIYIFEENHRFSN
jgi:hypothetical protein